MELKRSNSTLKQMTLFTKDFCFFFYQKFKLSFSLCFLISAELLSLEKVGSFVIQKQESPGDLMNIHMGNLISVFSLSVFPFEAGSKNINKDCTAIVSTFISL